MTFKPGWTPEQYKEHADRVYGTWNNRRVLRHKLHEEQKDVNYEKWVQYYRIAVNRRLLRHKLHEEQKDVNYEKWVQYYRIAVRQQYGFNQDVLCAYLTCKTSEERHPGECEKAIGGIANG